MLVIVYMYKTMYKIMKLSFTRLDEVRNEYVRGSYQIAPVVKKPLVLPYKKKIRNLYCLGST